MTDPKLLADELEALLKKAVRGEWQVYSEMAMDKITAKALLNSMVDDTPVFTGQMFMLTVRTDKELWLSPAITGCGEFGKAHAELIAAFVNNAETILAHLRAVAATQRDERAEFEKWCEEINITVSRDAEGGYIWPYTFGAWRAWQARAALQSHLAGDSGEPKHDAAPTVEQHIEYQLFCDGELVSGVSGLPDDALREIRHYAAQYAADGELECYRVTRQLVDLRSNEESRNAGDIESHDG